MPVSTKERYNETNTKLNDGSLIYGNSYRNASQEVINSKIQKYIIGDIYSIENFNEISDRIWQEFHDLISELTKEEITVEVFLCPYAPLVYETIKKEYPMVLKKQKK